MIDTRQRLVRATRQCVARQGLAATTSRDIAGAADANLGAITYYFGSKDELVGVALLEGLREWLTPAIEVLTSGGDPAERTLSAIRTLLSAFEQHLADAPLYLEALLQAIRMEPVHRSVLELWSDLRRLLTDQMRAMQGDGTLPAWVEPDAMASLFIAVANGLVLQATIDRRGPDLSSMAGQFGLLLLAVQR